MIQERQGDQFLDALGEAGIEQAGDHCLSGPQAARPYEFFLAHALYRRSCRRPAGIENICRRPQ